MELYNFKAESKKYFPEIEIEQAYKNFVPDEFKKDPIGYFKLKGKNIKSGEIKRDKTGRVREDPTAVRELPIWFDANGNELKTIGKRVDIRKGKIRESANPFYEYQIMELINDIGLPASKPIAKVEQAGNYLIVMEKVQGTSWYEKNNLLLKENGYTDEEIRNLEKQAEEKMAQLRAEFEEAGVKRSWKLKDMIFDIDIENKTIRKIIPVDWERTEIEADKLNAYRKNKLEQ